MRISSYLNYNGFQIINPRFKGEHQSDNPIPSNPSENAAENPTNPGHKPLSKRVQWMLRLFIAVIPAFPVGLIGYDQLHRRPKENRELVERVQRDFQRSEKEQGAYLSKHYAKVKSEFEKELFLTYFSNDVPFTSAEHEPIQEESRYIMDGASRWVIKNLHTLKDESARMRVILPMINKSSAWMRSSYNRWGGAELRYYQGREAIQAIMLKDTVVDAFNNPEWQQKVKELIECKEKTLTQKDIYLDRHWENFNASEDVAKEAAKRYSVLYKELKTASEKKRRF